MKTVGLCMIVKNEAHIIRRCLTRALPLIDYALIVDTGSTDHTIAEIKAFLAENKLAGEVVEEPWRDFAHNRSSALARLREHGDIDYALMIDADDDVRLAPDFDRASFKESLSADFYDVVTDMNGYVYTRPQLTSNRKKFYYKAILHEYLECEVEGSRQVARHFSVRAMQDSARNQIGDKYRRDAALLETALETEADPFLRARYTFYLAQSWRDCGEMAKALDYYLRRAEMGYWEEEIFYSRYFAAKLMENLGHDNEAVVALYLRAAEASPGRAEALHGAARRLRLAGEFQRGYEVGKRAIDLPPPPYGLFVEPWIYDFAALDEFAVNAYWAGHYRESLEAVLRALRTGKVPADEIPRFAQNGLFALEKLSS